ncbi:MAG: hypothetical protein JW885_10125 [Deltaproteobacteria bacterium]|nr:hypothetical protein [Candidatus Zymogenaceae bacterium]
MKRIGAAGRKWLNGTHMFFASAWVGAAVSLTTLRLFSLNTGVQANGDILYAVNACIKLIDDAIIIPAALGTLLTGFLISLLTPWGFFTYRWVTVKWVVTLSTILFGTFFLGPWVNELTALADTLRAAASSERIFHILLFRHTLWGGVQTVILIAAVFISAVKPWGKKG